jgi:hypothetical protein
LICGVPLLQQIVNLKIEEAYSKIKAAFVEKGCRVLSEESPRQICFRQGSLWGVLPKTAKKIVKVSLHPMDEGAKVSCSSKLASEWKNITLIGCALAVALAGLCVWMAIDLNKVLATHQSSFWSWLVMMGGNVDSAAAAQTFINLTWGLAIFLSAIIFLEGAIVIYVRSKIDAFAEDVLNQLC